MRKQQKPFFENLFGEATPAKRAGLAFSFSALLAPILALVITVILFLFNAKGYEGKDWYAYVNFLLPQLVFALVAFAGLSYTKTPLKEFATSQKCKPKYFLIALFLQIGLLCLSQLNTWFLEILGEIGYQDAGISLPSMDGFGFFGVLFVVGVLPAIFEEIFFRGILIEGLRCFKNVWAVLVCGALFALYHQNPAQTLYQFCCGACFALIAIRSGSILPTVFSHFLNNAFILIVTKCGITAFSKTALWIIMPISAVCLLGTLGYLIFADKQLEKTTDVSQQKVFFRYALIGIAVCALSWLMVLLAGI